MSARQRLSAKGRALFISGSVLSLSLLVVPSAAAAVHPHVGGTLTASYAVGTWPDVFNPYSPQGAPGGAISGVVESIYEPLIQWNVGNGHDLPWLASHWTWSDHNRVLTMNLQKGVRWSNGTPFTSQDVLFTLNMLKQYPAADYNALWTYMSKVQTAGPNAIKITLKAPNSTFLYYLGETYIVPPFQFAHVNPVTYPDTHPVGTGPYLLKKYTPEVITETRNPHYWKAPEPYIQTIRTLGETSNTGSILGLTAGQIDWSSDYSPNLQHVYVDRNPRTNHYNLTGGSLDIVYVNLKQYPLSLPVVRRAISDALNRPLISRLAFSGYSTPATLDGIPASMAKDWATSKLTKQSQATYNPSLAKRLLLKAGFKAGAHGMLMAPNGKPFAVNFVVAAPFTAFAQASSQMAAELQAIGISATVQETSISNYLARIQDGHFSLAIMWSPVGPNPFFILNQLMNTAYSAPVGQAAPSNMERYANPQVQAWASQFELSTNGALHKRITDALASLMQKELPVIPLLNRNEPNEYSTAHLSGWPTPQNLYWNDVVSNIVVLNRLYSKP